MRRASTRPIRFLLLLATAGWCAIARDPEPGALLAAAGLPAFVSGRDFEDGPQVRDQLISLAVPLKKSGKLSNLKHIEALLGVEIVVPASRNTILVALEPEPVNCRIRSPAQPVQPRQGQECGRRDPAGT